MRYCESPYSYHRRRTREVVVGDPARGGVIIGGDHPIVKQSMLTCDTMDTALSIRQTLELVAVGCQIVRITAPTVKDAANLEHIVRGLRELGYSDVSSDDLIAARIHGVTPEYVREIQEAGYRDVTMDQLVAMRIHGVDARYARAIRRRDNN